MAISREQQDKVAAFLNSQGVKGCIACGFTGTFLFGDIAILPDSYEHGQIRGVGLLPVTCQKCGYTMLFDQNSLPI